MNGLKTRTCDTYHNLALSNKNLVRSHPIGILLVPLALSRNIF